MSSDGECLEVTTCFDKPLAYTSASVCPSALRQVCARVCEPGAKCWLKLSQVRPMCGLLSSSLHHSSSPASPPNLTAVPCHSLMDAPGPTIAHYSLLLLSLRSQSRQGQIYFTVVHLSHSARWHLCYGELGGMPVCVCLKKEEGNEKGRDRMT